jgi:DNA-binding response OmpR family regulator
MSSIRVLAVDDSPTILEMIQAILVAGGYDVITASDGQEALNAARSESPDLILLDVMLPKLDGYRVCRLL